MQYAVPVLIWEYFKDLYLSTVVDYCTSIFDEIMVTNCNVKSCSFLPQLICLSENKDIELKMKFIQVKIQGEASICEQFTLSGSAILSCFGLIIVSGLIK